MTIKEIITKIYSHRRKIGRLPRSGERALTAYAKEGQRKIGSWRKVLWVSGVIDDERRKQLPHMTFVYKDGSYELSEDSMRRLERICQNGCRKEKMF